MSVIPPKNINCPWTGSSLWGADQRKSMPGIDVIFQIFCETRCSLCKYQFSEKLSLAVQTVMFLFASLLCLLRGFHQFMRLQCKIPRCTRHSYMCLPFMVTRTDLLSSIMHRNSTSLAVTDSFRLTDLNTAVLNHDALFLRHSTRSTVFVMPANCFSLLFTRSMSFALVICQFHYKNGMLLSFIAVILNVFLC